MRAQSMRSTQVLKSACRPAPRGPIHKNETQKEDPSRMLSSIKMGDVGVVHPKATSAASSLSFGEPALSERCHGWACASEAPSKFLGACCCVSTFLRGPTRSSRRSEQSRCDYFSLATADKDGMCCGPAGKMRDKSLASRELRNCDSHRTRLATQFFLVTCSSRPS